MRPLILIVNDDGIFSPGLVALCEAVDEIGDLLIVAPSCQQTSMGRSYPKHLGLGIIKEVLININNKDIKAYSVEASPSYAVAYAVKEIADRNIDLCISGINYGENLGKTISYSGTVGATMQSADFGIPSIAISRPTSLENINESIYTTLDWTLSQNVASFWAKKVLSEGPPFSAPILNINVPESLDNPSIYKYTMQSDYDMFSFIEPLKRDFTKAYTLPSKKRDNFNCIEPNSDIYAVCIDNVVSVTPIECNLTMYSFINEDSKHHG